MNIEEQAESAAATAREVLAAGDVIPELLDPEIDHHGQRAPMALHASAVVCAQRARGLKQRDPDRRALAIVASHLESAATGNVSIPEARLLVWTAARRMGRSPARTVRAVLTAWNALQAGRPQMLVAMAKNRGWDAGAYRRVFWDHDDAGEPIPPADPGEPRLPARRFAQLVGLVRKAPPADQPAPTMK